MDLDEKKEFDKKLKKMNNSYKEDKEAYKKLSKAQEVLNKNTAELRKMQRKKEDFLIYKKRAIEDKDKIAEKNAEAQIEIADKEIANLKGKISKLYNILKNSKEKVDSYIDELSQDPEFKVQINYILKQRYERAAKKVEKKKEQTDKLIDICKNHPTIANNLKGMIKAKEKIKKLDEELKKLDVSKDAARIVKIINYEIPEWKNKLSTNEINFKEFCKNNNIEFDEKFLNEIITENSFKHDKDGNIKLDETLKNISKGYARNVKAYEVSISKVAGITKIESKTKMKSKEGIEEHSGLPATKFKWYEIRKRFNAWKDRRNVKKEQKENEQKMEKIEKPSEKFQNAYKYDVVKDYVDKKEQEILKASQREVRNQNTDEQER